jgi:YVTN family beta-propeller protein
MTHGVQRRRKRAAALAASLLLPLAVWGASGAASAEEAESAGIRVGFTLSALTSDRPASAGREAAFAFTLTTGKNDAPLRGARPAAWLVPHVAGERLDQRQCRRIAATFVRGASLAVPALDLNIFYILALAGDASMLVIDPRIGFGGSRLAGLATFDATASDWALTPDQSVLAVAQPSAGRIALIDTRDWSVNTTIALPGAARLALSPDGHMLLASYRIASGATETESGVALVDLARAAEAPLRIATGGGAHDIAIDAQGQIAFVSNEAADTVSVIDLATRQVTRTVPTGHGPVALAWSALARRAYAAASDGSITAVSAAPEPKSAGVAGPPGISALRFAPGERFLVAASPQTGEIVVIDTATNRIVQRFEVAGEPDAIGFSDRVMFVRRRASEFVDAFPLDQIGVDGRKPSAVSVGVGQLALGALSAPARADVMAGVPSEGMAAPSASFSTYGREPRAVKILDRRLREVEPGVYRTIAQLPRAGSYDVVFYTETPRTVQCFETRVDPDAASRDDTARTPLVTDLALDGKPRAGQPLAVQFRLVDPQTGAPVSSVRDARVVSFAIPGQSAGRSAAQPLGGGAYRADITVPAAGNYYVFVEAPSVALAPVAGRLVAVAPADTQ